MTAQLTDMRIVLAGHGSRDADGIAEFETFAAMFKERCAGVWVKHGYLEFQSPTIEEAVAAAAAEEGGPLVVIPALLAAATHAKNDTPSLLNQLKQKFPEQDIRFSAVIDIHATLLKLCQRRIVEAEAASSQSIKRSDSCLIVVGRGTSDPDANGDIAKIARMLQEGMGFDASLTCYSGTAHPLVQDGLQAAAKLGHKRIVVMPYFLFDGVLVKRIYAAADQLQKRMPQIEVLKAHYLGVEQDIASVLIERAYEAVHGEPKMNCGLCKYRVPIVGYESQVGVPQGPHRELVPYVALGSLGAREDACGPRGTRDGRGPLGQYEPHPIEAASFEIIRSSFDWSVFPEEQRSVLMRLVHTTGDFEAVQDMFFSAGVVSTGIRALLRCRRVVTDVTMVQTGLKRALLGQLGIETWCGVHDRETETVAKAQNLTRSAAGIRRAFELFGNDMVLAIGDAPTAIAEAVRLVREQRFRPQLIVGLPVGFVGTAESKELLKSCIQVPRITNKGTRGGSPWAATVINALLIEAVNQVAVATPANQAVSGGA